MRTLKYRLGQFCLVIGLMLLVVFFLQGQNPTPLFFFAGLGGAVLGLLLMRRTHAPSEPSERFRSVRKYLERPKKR